MKRILQNLSVAVLATLPLVGCIDANYDLSNIDTTSRVNFTDLVLPVNIDPITIGNVISFDSDSKIQVATIGGQEFYALVQSGDFTSEAINIEPVTAKAPSINPTHKSLDIQFPEGVLSGRRRISGLMDVTCPISEVGANFDYNASDIDAAIVSINDVETKPFNLSMNLNLEIEGAEISDIIIRDVKIRAPKGLTCEPSIGSYDMNTGIWTIPEFDISGDAGTIKLTASDINTIIAGAPIQADHSLNFHGEFFIESATAEVKANFNNVDISNKKADFTLNYEFNDFEATAVTGEIAYYLGNISIPSISLGDIPEFLKGDKTNINLANPQIYLSVNNPVYKYGVKFDAGLLIETERASIDNKIAFRPEQEIEVKADPNIGEAPYNFLLSPDFDKRNVPTEPYDYSSNLQFVPFPALSGILTTPSYYNVKGLPDNVYISLENPRIPDQTISNFKLEPISGVTGHYTVVAPLALQDGSYIYYSDFSDGWNDEGDLDDLIINKLELTAQVKNSCPVDIEIAIYPVDKERKRLENVTITTSKVAANSEGEFVIGMEGEISGLDGIEYEAVLTGDSSEEALNPNLTLTLTDIKAKVSGYYQTEL